MRLDAKTCGTIFHGGFTQQKLGLELIENQQLNSDWNQTHWDFIHLFVQNIPSHGTKEINNTKIDENVCWPKQDIFFHVTPLSLVGSIKVG